MTNYEIQSERVLLRSLRISDAEDMYAYTSNGESCNYLMWDAHTNVNQAVMFIQRALQKQDELFLGIIEKKSKILLGSMHVYDFSLSKDSCFVSYIVNPTYQLHGYASEALRALILYLFNKRDIETVKASCIVENAASERVMQKVGMQFDEEIKNAILIKGKMYNLRIYKITKET